MTDTRIRPEPTKHSPLGASGSYRWMHCPGYYNLAQKLPKTGQSNTSPAAAEGSAAHEIAAAALAEGVSAQEYVGMEVEIEDWVFVVDEDMATHIDEYINNVGKLLSSYPDAKLYVEEDLGPSHLHDLCYGKGDVIIHVPDERVIVVDFKYGKGIVVEPDSSQLKIYAALACEKFVGETRTLEAVDLYISQPRIFHSNGTFRRHSMTPKELNEWFIGDLIPKMKLAENPEVDTLVVGDWCRFCPVQKAKACPALNKEVFEFDVALEPSHMDNEQLGNLLMKKDAITNYLEQCSKEAFRRAIGGEKIPGKKLVRKQAYRKYRDGAESYAATFFGQEAYDKPKLKSPAQLEKLGEEAKKFVEEWAFKPDTGLTLADESSPKAEVQNLLDLAKSQGTYPER